ncbi:MAG: ribbon-helix-helix domain-containing protein [Nanoarchaeota archaeon]|nr:ribbon-helix-helix domain-containing protein [Nanoarchaeota archaeon]MBU1604955.1 ribbon-helix-helix domain-containing protein [Nanoarchaeota archaeon]MBU2443315.1 ribbon-helix-helix domain-containing protein [Nanoarchaeota archaeon]
MKIKLSVSMDENVVRQAEEVIEEGRFRNKSHIIEYALKSFLKGE